MNLMIQIIFLNLLIIAHADSELFETAPEFENFVSNDWLTGSIPTSNDEANNEELVPSLTFEMVMEELAGRRELRVESKRRDLQVLNAPEEWYEQCVYWVNAVRAREALPALKRWREKEPCTDGQAEYDYAEYRDKRRPHAAFADKKHCNIGGSDGIYAQNSCPLWQNSIDANERCTIAMWEEKQNPGITDDLKCASGVSSDCGHYWTLRGGSEGSGGYNRYDRVACGFYFHPTENKIYLNQNFGISPQKEFLCGGDSNQRPQANLVPDCSIRGDYGSCGAVNNIDYDVPGCQWKDCDPGFDSNTMACSNKNGCPSTGSDRCESSYFLNHQGQFTEWFKYACRELCDTCGCPANSPETDAVVCQSCPAELASCDSSCAINGDFCVVTENSCKTCSIATCQQCIEGSCPACHRCDPVEGCIPTAGTKCDDGNEFTHSDVCLADGTCQGTEVDQSENVFCFNVDNDPSVLAAANFAEGDFVLTGTHNGKGWYRHFQSKAVLYWHAGSFQGWVITLPDAAKQPGDAMSQRCVSTTDVSPVECGAWEKYTSTGWVPINFLVGKFVCPCLDQISACPNLSTAQVCSNPSLISTCPARCNVCYAEPATKAPVSLAPVTQMPITQSPVTQMPITQSPVTHAPVTKMPITQSPVTQMPITQSPVTQAPVTQMPITQSPVTQAPVTQMPITQSPFTESPVTSAPVTKSPVSLAPVTETPVTPSPRTNTPVTSAPIITVTNSPTTGAPITQTPVTNAPVTKVPLTKAPITLMPVTDAPVTEAPITSAPITQMPITESPITNVPITQMPVTKPPTPRPTISRLSGAPTPRSKSLSFESSTYDSRNLGGAFAIDVVGDLTFVGAYRRNQLTILDTSDPKNVVTKGTLLSTTKLKQPTAIVVRGNYAYVAAKGNKRVTVVDISNPETPELKASILDNRRFYNVWAMILDINRPFLYVASKSYGTVTVVDVTNPTAPIIKNTFRTSQLRGAQSMAMRGQDLYVLTNSARLVEIDCASPQTGLRYKSSVRDNYRMRDPRGIVIKADFAYISSRRSHSISIYRLGGSTPARVGFLASYQLLGADGVAFDEQNNLLYVAATYTHSLAVVDVSDRAYPRVVDKITDQVKLRYTRKIVLKDNLVYLTTYSRSRLTIVSNN